MITLRIAFMVGISITFAAANAEFTVYNDEASFRSELQSVNVINFENSLRIHRIPV
jgi:hypothetical protein